MCQAIFAARVVSSCDGAGLDANPLLTATINTYGKVAMDCVSRQTRHSDMVFLTIVRRGMHIDDSIFPANMNQDRKDKWRTDLYFVSTGIHSHWLMTFSSKYSRAQVADVTQNLSFTIQTASPRCVSCNAFLCWLLQSFFSETSALKFLLEHIIILLSPPNSQQR